ncbi:fibronectin type III domain-containing protein [Chloroflexota bacterium]
MPTVSFTHTEINPSHSEGSGGGMRAHTVIEQNPTHGVGSGGGRRIFVETELIPMHVIGAGGGRKAFVLEEIPPILSLPLPGIKTGPATDIGLAETTINGFLEDDGGMLCDCAFEWGLTESYGRITSVQSKTAGEYFSELLTGLEPDTLYHFRAIAYNVFGISRGSDMAFRTLNTLPPLYFQNPLISLLEEETW